MKLIEIDEKEFVWCTECLKKFRLPVPGLYEEGVFTCSDCVLKELNEKEKQN